MLIEKRKARTMQQQQIKLLEPETNEAKCKGDTIKDIGHEETNKPKNFSCRKNYVTKS